LTDSSGIWASGVFGIVGVIVGAFLGSLLAARAQHKQWVADSRKQEFHEIMSAINQGFTRLLAFSTERPFTHDDAYERELRLAEASTAGRIMDSIVIAKEVGRLHVMERWTNAARAFSRDGDVTAFGDAVNNLISDIRQTALHDIESRSHRA
jgi:hypothetical protein